MVSGRRRHVDPAMQPQRLDELVETVLLRPWS
jgi:hypothetical protein